MGVSMGGIYPTWDTVPLWCAAILVFFSLRLLLPEQRPWKRFLILLLLCVFWGPSLRTAFAVFAFAVLLRGWYAVAEGRIKPYVFGCVAALLCATAFLVAADQGMYALAALLVTFAAVAIDSRRTAQRRRQIFARVASRSCWLRCARGRDQFGIRPSFRFSFLARFLRASLGVSVGYTVSHGDGGEPFISSER